MQQQSTLPTIPRNIKFVDLPNHVKEALLALEKTVVETTHKAASPFIRTVDKDVDTNKELQQLFDSLTGYTQDCFKEHLLLETLQKDTDLQHQHTELAIRTVERFKNPQHRSGLEAMDGPMSLFEHRHISKFQSRIDTIQAELNRLVCLLDWIQLQFDSPINAYGKIQATNRFADVCQQIHHRILHVATSLVSLERSHMSKKAIK
jgi:hypothetical protein